MLGLAALQSIFAFDPDEPVPDVKELLIKPCKYLCGNQWLGINKVVIIMMIAAVLTVVFFTLGSLNAKLVPSGLQNLVETTVDFVRNGIINEVIGPNGMWALPLLTAMFVFIFFLNIFEVIPGISYPGTARLAVPAALAVMVWVIFQVVGIVYQGPAWYIRTIWPKSVPLAIRPLYAAIEFVAVFFVRPFSLAVRLGANLIAGHVMLSVFFIFAYNFTEFKKGLPVGVAATLLAIALTVFEILVSFLQAYIFTILTAVYIGESMHHEH
jgi:F-type H+-transporting ATPase subunit a